MPKKHVRATRSHPSKPSGVAKKSTKDRTASKAPRAEHAPAVKSSGDLAAQVKRLAGDLEALKAEGRKRPGGGAEEGFSRRDQDKILADRLARLDEKIESLWGRVSDLEEHFEGEGGGRTREPDFDETPERDFYEH